MNNILQEKSFIFALRIIKLYQHLSKEKNEYVLSKQVLRSGTSIGANIEEAIGAQSKKEFKSKLSIAYKESRETHYWLRLLTESALLEKKLSQSLISDCDEILKITGTILKKLKDQPEQST